MNCHWIICRHLIRREYIKKLIITSVLVFPITLLIYHLFPAHLSKMSTFILGMGIYWIFIGLSILFIMGQLKDISQIFKKEKKGEIFWNALAFLPVFGVFFICFLPGIQHISMQRWIIIIIIATVNGFLEETFWRGLYLIKFENNRLVRFLLSPVLFGLWHISLWHLKDITYVGGFMALVGGALAMGFIWSFVSGKLKNIRTCIYAHILTNIFAFTGLFAENFF